MAGVINAEVLGPFLEEEIGETMGYFENVRSLNIVRNGNRIDIVLSIASSKGFGKLKIAFNDVRNLKVDNLTLDSFETTVLYITDISDRGMEGINWSVGHDEDWGFEFYCEAIEILSAKLNIPRGWPD